MSKVSMAQAAKLFAVSRPSLAKHLKAGKISGEKAGDSWQLDTSELARVYPLRAGKDAGTEHAELPERDRGAASELQAEIRVLQARLEAAEAMAEERGRHIEDLRRALEAPARHPQHAGPWWRWWPFK